MSETKTDFDFLVGLTESAAFELVQAHDYIPRVMRRDAIPLRASLDTNPRRVNLYVMENRVAGWTIG